MNKHNVKLIVLSVFLSIGAYSGLTHAVQFSDDIKHAQKADAKNHKAAQESQKKIDSMYSNTETLLGEYRKESKIVDGLVVYNTQLERKIVAQIQKISELDKSINDVSVIRRQLVPLMGKMVDAIEEFINLDLPFALEERYQRLEYIKKNIEDPEVSVSEKFRQVLEMYEIENKYGRNMKTYQQVIKIDGVERTVDVLKVGRIALVYQTPDGSLSGAWDKATGSWVEVGESYQKSIRQAIRMAQSTASKDIMMLPISAAE